MVHGSPSESRTGITEARRPMFSVRHWAGLFAALVWLVTSPALAFAPEPSCEGWTAQGPWGGPAYGDASALLERYDNGSWVVVDGGTDQQLMTEPGTLMLGSDWSGAGTAAIGDGTYRVRLSVTVYSMMSFMPTAADLAAYPREKVFVFESTSSTFECTAPAVEFGDARTPGYWKNHIEAWPVASLSIGGTSYSSQCLLGMLDGQVSGDIRLPLLHHLIATKLNLLAGSDPRVVTHSPAAGATVLQTVTAADAFLSGTAIQCGSSSLSGSAPKGASKASAEAIKDALDAYNNNSL